VITNHVGIEEVENGFEFEVLGDTPVTAHHLIPYTSFQVREINSFTGDSKLLKRRALKLLVNSLLQSLVHWHDKVVENEKRCTVVEDNTTEDDAIVFTKAKNRKQALVNGIKRFNIKYKKGIKYLIDTGCIKSDTPIAIAEFLFKTQVLDKICIGEYIGEGYNDFLTFSDAVSIEIMHEFVDQMSFKRLTFTTALRQFLQHFRLPGEAQKIDRIMLKFASRFTKDNPDSFSSADTAYVLAYSVIMLNTDLHNPQVKKRMALSDFIKNNRGIDDGKDVDREFLEVIYNEILSSEIILKDERIPKLKTIEVLGKVQKSKQKSELIKSIDEKILNSREKHVWVTGSHVEHLRSMFQIGWMSILMSVSSTLSKSSNLENVVIALEGYLFLMCRFKAATHLACVFDLTLEKNAFGNISYIYFSFKPDQVHCFIFSIANYDERH
jgi:brefeldin A-inhibited guanine nucleotide-exchange protein